MLAKYQNIIVTVIVLVIAFAAYSYFFTGKETPALTSQSVASASSADQELIALLLELKSMTLDESIFSDQKFKSLQDFSRDLVPEPVGRQNPFAPLGK